MPDLSRCKDGEAPMESQAPGYMGILPQASIPLWQQERGGSRLQALLLDIPRGSYQDLARHTGCLASLGTVFLINRTGTGTEGPNSCPLGLYQKRR
jgi:hypothetical protein